MTTAAGSGETDEQHNRILGNEGDDAEAGAFGKKVKPAEKPSRAKKRRLSNSTSGGATIQCWNSCGAP